MANIILNKSKDNKKIFLISDDIDTTDNYPVIVHWVNGEVFKTYTKDNDPQTIDGETYTPSSGVQALDFVSTLTTLGTYYIFEINSFVSGESSTDLEPLTNGIHKFDILELDSNDIFLGEHIDSDIQCCIAKKLDKIVEGAKGCDPEKSLEDINKLFSILKSIEASLSEQEFINASNKRNLALNICNTNCKCGCS